jgi:SAM-dependent methyltransferase
MQAYNEGFAKIYNMRWCDFAQRIAPRIREFYEGTATGQADKSLLDVCCGAGHLALHFLENGYNVTGLDSSSAILRYAAENARVYIEQGRVHFVEGDAADFSLDDRFGLAVSTFDALNHLPDMAALRGCFRSVFAVLVEEGWFIFDLNTRQGLQRWAGMSVQNADDLVIITRGVVMEEQHRAYTQISGFLKVDNGLYERFEQTAFNTVFDLDEVHAALLDLGFRSAYFARGRDLATAIDVPEDEPRAFIVAQK